MEKTRLQVLSEVLSIPAGQIFTRNSLLSGEPVEANSSEFVVKNEGQEVYYDVLKDDELDARVEDLINDCYSEEEIVDTYGLDEEGNPDLSTADINTYLVLVAEKDDYYVYTAE